MEPTQFLEYIKKYAPKLVLKITQVLNDQERNGAYYHQRFLKPKYSVTGSWETITKQNQAIAADVIALDSSIPLKSNPVISTYGGEIPKVATERAHNESDLRKLDIMVKSNVDDETIRTFIFDHWGDVIKGQYERQELHFLQGLSTGQILLTNADNVGSNVRVDFGYKPDNKFFASVIWGNSGYKPLSDLSVAYEKSAQDGTPISKFLIDRATFNLIRQSDEAKSYFNPLAQTSPSLNLEQLNSIAETQFGFSFEIIQRSVNVEINGKITKVNPWQAGTVIGITSDDLGALVWSDVAEMNHHVGGTEYQRAGNQNYILVKQYRMNRPSLKEVTASESCSLPVIANVTEIYSFNSKAVS